MATIYVSLGNSDDKLSQVRWHAFRQLVLSAVHNTCTRVYGDWVSESGAQWQNACVAFELEDKDIPGLKAEMASLAREFQQDSIAWAHVPHTEFIGPTSLAVGGPVEAGDWVVGESGDGCTFPPTGQGIRSDITLNVTGTVTSQEEFSKVLRESIQRWRGTGGTSTASA